MQADPIAAVGSGSAGRSGRSGSAGRSGVEPPPRPSTARAFWLAARPRTLPLALAPVVVGSAVALAEGRASAAPAFAAAWGALWLQIGANFANDAFDAERGADAADRLGPPRAAAQGWLTPSQLRWAMGLAFASAAAAGAWLVVVAGWPIAAVGVASIAAAVAYTGGPFPFGYHGLGEAAVFLFFGVAAVAGSHYVQALAWSGTALAAAIPVGALATAVLAVNNLRDLASDARAGKRTLAVRLGPRGARAEVLALLALPYAAAGSFAVAWSAPALLLPFASAPRALGLARRVAAGESGRALNAVLAGTARLALEFALLFAVGLLWPS